MLWWQGQRRRQLFRQLSRQLLEILVVMNLLQPEDKVVRSQHLKPFLTNDFFFSFVAALFLVVGLLLRLFLGSVVGGVGLFLGQDFPGLRDGQISKRY